MANSNHLAVLKKGVDSWNDWRADQNDVLPDLSQLDLARSNLSEYNLKNVNLSLSVLFGANLQGAILEKADLSRTFLNEANLTNANLKGADLNNATLRYASLMNADLSKTNFRAADLSGSILSDADTSGANFNSSILKEVIAKDTFFYRSSLNLTDFSGSIFTGSHFYEIKFYHTVLSKANFAQCSFQRNIFSNIDLSVAEGLENVEHLGPSTLGIETLYISGGKIPIRFLRGCGIPETLIDYLPSLLGAQKSVEFFSCFISYSSRDVDFATRLYSRMQQEKLRVWYAPEDMKGGKKIFEQIETAIQVQDRLLLVLSEESMQSEWVINEIRNAIKVEKKENRRKLFPIRLIEFEKLKKWELKDADSGKDLAVEIREYFIPDFSHWKEHDEFEKSFKRLIKDLKNEER